MLERISELLADPDAHLSVSTRYRYEGGKTVLEALLSDAPFLKGPSSR